MIIPSAQVCFGNFTGKGTTHEHRHVLTGVLFSSQDTPQELMALMENAKLQHQECPDKTKILGDQLQRFEQMSDAHCTWQGPEDTTPPYTHHKALLWKLEWSVSWMKSSLLQHSWGHENMASPGTLQLGEIAWKSYPLPVWAFFFLHSECLWHWMKQNCTKALSEQNETAHMRSTLRTAIAL